MEIRFPFGIDRRGRSAISGLDAHIRDLIEQILFTVPGERVNRPDFGAGLNRLLFAPNSPELAAATEATVRGELQRWLADRIQVEAVAVKSVESTLNVTVSYAVRRTGERVTATFSREATS